jgi:hypothetical protein
MAFIGFGQNDSGGQANPGLQPMTIVWATASTPSIILPTGTQRGPTNTGILYQLSGSVVTSGFGQIFPTGRT